MYRRLRYLDLQINDEKEKENYLYGWKARDDPRL